MKKSQMINNKIDFQLTITIGYFFALSIIFSFFKLGESISGYVMITSLMIVSLISYYLGKTFGLISAMVVDFIYCTYLFYISFTTGRVLNNTMYFWIIIIPFSALLTASLSENIVALQEKVLSLELDNEELVMIDEAVGVKNGKAFLNEMPIYINLNKRHKIPVTLLLVKVKHSKNFRKILGEKVYLEMIKNIAEVLDKCLRYEDVKYILDNETFAYVLVTDNEGANIVKSRMKKAIREMKFKNKSIGKELNIEVAIGVYSQDEKVNDPISFIKLAEKELSYDV